MALRAWHVRVRDCCLKALLLQRRFKRRHNAATVCRARSLGGSATGANVFPNATRFWGVGSPSR
eukprot:364925-Chlamydomonas_euryale.AAC.7